MNPDTPNKNKSCDLEVRDLILEFEKRCDPFSYQVEGFCIWPVFRFGIFENLKIIKGGYNSRPARKKKSRLFQLVNAMAIIPKEANKLIKCYFNKDKIDILALTDSYNIRDQVNGAYRNIYFDYFDPALDNILYWYTTSKNEDRLYSSFSSLFIDDKMRIFTKLFAKYKCKRYINIISSLYNVFVHFLRTNYYQYQSDIYLSKWINEFEIFLSQKYALNLLVKIINPKLFLLVCYYCNEGFVAAAKSMNIPVWELQHGLFYDGHMAYAYNKDLVKNYRMKLPLPDKILTFGKYFSQILTKYGCWRESDVPEVGFPRLEYFQQRYTFTKSYKKHKLKVLISSQWLLAEKIVSYLTQIISFLPEGIIIKVKPHPAESKDFINQYKTLGDKIEVISQNTEFYDALPECQIHCSVFSTTLFESIGLGVPTLIIGLPEAIHVSSLVKFNCAKMAKTPSDFIKILQKAKSHKQYLKKWQEETVSNRSYFWQPDSCRKIQLLFLQHINETFHYSFKRNN